MTENEILVTYGIGEGETNVAAYYAALKDAGIHPLNFIEEVPLIPEGSTVRVLEPKERAELSKRGKWGDLAYLTLARSFGNDRGRVYFAGLGWVQDADGTGFFLRYPGIDPVTLYDEASVEELLKKGVGSIIKADGEQNWEPIDMKHKIESIKCEGEPAAALVCALFDVLPLYPRK